jgi:hypothetical protein
LIAGKGGQRRVLRLAEIGGGFDELQLRHLAVDLHLTLNSVSAAVPKLRATGAIRRQVRIIHEFQAEGGNLDRLVESTTNFTSLFVGA